MFWSSFCSVFLIIMETFTSYTPNRCLDCSLSSFLFSISFFTSKSFSLIFFSNTIISHPLLQRVPCWNHPPLPPISRHHGHVLQPWHSDQGILGCGQSLKRWNCCRSPGRTCIWPSWSLWSPWLCLLCRAHLWDKRDRSSDSCSTEQADLDELQWSWHPCPPAGVPPASRSSSCWCFASTPSWHTWCFPVEPGHVGQQ